MRKLTITGLLLICGFFAHLATAYGQNRSKSAVSIHIVAVRGDCMPAQAVTIYNGRAVATPAQSTSDFGEGKQPTLTRFGEDDRVRESIELIFKKNRALRVVNSIEEADLVFHVCSSYWEEFGSKFLLNGKPILPTLRVAALALAIPALAYRPDNGLSSKLASSAIWKADTLTYGLESVMSKEEKKRAKERDDLGITRRFEQGDFNARIIFSSDFTSDMLREVSPLDLAQSFNKEVPRLKKELAKLPRQRYVVGNGAFEKRLPTLITDRRDLNVRATNRSTTQQARDGTNSEDESLKIGTALVTVPLSAMDKNGKYIPGLIQGNFKVFEDGVEQQIIDFQSTEMPFHVVLMLDVSESTVFKIEDIQNAALNFINQLRPQDRVMVLSFDRTVRVATEFTNQRDELNLAVVHARTGNATRVYDAIDLAITKRLSKIQGRKAIIVFTDGMDTASRLAKIEDVIEHIEESGALVYPVRYNTFEDEQLPAAVAAKIPVIAATRSRNNYEFATKFLIELAERSGGRYYNVETIGDTKEAFARIVEELRRQYWIGYYSSNPVEDGSFRQIRVTVDVPGVVNRARRGYRASGGSTRPQKPPRPMLRMDKN